MSRFRINSKSATKHYIEERGHILWWTFWTRVREWNHGYAGSSCDFVCKSSVAEAKQWIDEFLYNERIALNEKLERKLNYPKVIEYP